MSEIRSPSRRALLFGRVPTAPRPAAIRPPWAKAEPEFLAACTRCDACVQACPEQVLIRDADGLPRFEARAGECTFCGDCVAACDSGAFEPADTLPWTLVAQVAGTCLSAQGVVCASCREVCPASAIRVSPGARGAPTIDVEACTGCGACVAPCPVDAITLQDTSAMEAVA
ncbi:ferredoxin-type protein NapF [Pseudoxanthomonas sp. Root630]|uniref:ferredoxin-type protein NapF n=1 Tax=Pseudoxanthomonas sp. Root630 TaxID=1736574 RepID=UPI00070296BE|nr:ferredoxin-type protein NapF [Pseudoxanthomonas sp. Root630]KRA45254.1 ferredoxin-type protein NapF [Pseudoxanthomonas sp. Root630]